MDSQLWRAWAQIERIAGDPGRIEVVTDARSWPSTEHRHLHPNPTGVVALSGVVGLALADGRRLHLQPGDCCLIGTGVWHEHDPTGQGGLWLGQGFMPTWSDLTVAPLGVRGIGRVEREPTRSLLVAALAAAPEGRRAAVRAWLAQLVQEPVRMLWPEDRAQRAMVFRMWRGTHVRIDPEDLVRVSCAARARAYRLFAEWYGMTPKAFILASRLELAETLLAQGLGVAETAWRCGWDTPDTFARCWRRAHGAPPAEWQRRHRDAGATGLDG